MAILGTAGRSRQTRKTTTDYGDLLAQFFPLRKCIILDSPEKCRRSFVGKLHL
jgi:hypothetical protein